MHDIHGCVLHIDDLIRTNAFGICTIVAIVEEDNYEKQGANVRIRTAKNEEFNMRLGLGGAERIILLKEMAQDALDCQRAVNLSGVVHSFSRIMKDLRYHVEVQCKKEGTNFNTEKLNQHPVCILFSTQIAFLSGHDAKLAYHNAYAWVEEHAK